MVWLMIKAKNKTTKIHYALTGSPHPTDRAETQQISRIISILWQATSAVCFSQKTFN